MVDVVLYFSSWIFRILSDRRLCLSELRIQTFIWYFPEQINDSYVERSFWIYLMPLPNIQLTYYDCLKESFKKVLKHHYTVSHI